MIGEIMCIIVPPHMYEMADWIINSKQINENGNYVQHELRDSKRWSRKAPLGATWNFFPQSIDEWGCKIKTTRAMRKRGHKKFYFIDEWNKIFPRFCQSIY